MRILIIRNTTRFSGSETYTINLIQSIKKYLKWDIVFWTNLDILAASTSELGISTRKVAWGSEGVGTKKQFIIELIRLVYTLPLFLFELSKFKHIDYIILQSMNEKIFYTPLLRLLKHKIIWTELGPIYRTRMSRVVTTLYKFTSKLTVKIIVISKDTKKDLVKGGVNRSKIIPIYTGLDIEKLIIPKQKALNALKRKFNIPEKSKIIGFLGTITHEKGIDIFIQSAISILNKSKRFFFIIIGDGPELEFEMSKIHDSKNKNHFLFTGFQNTPYKYISLFDILFLPTRHHEGTPLAILESMALKKIVVTTNMGGNTEIIQNGYNGYILRSLNIPEITRVLVHAAKDTPKNKNIVHNARNTILSKFNQKTQAIMIKELFQHI